MQLQPEKRLGAGQPGTDNDYEHLKSHPFFKGINFKKLEQTSPPIPTERFQLAFNKPEIKKDVIDKLALELNDDSDDEFMIGGTRKDNHKNNGPKHESKDPMLIKTGIVTKKKSVIKTRKVKLTLTNQPRLYYTNEQGEYKADILITPYVKAVSKGSNRFDIQCSKSGKVIVFNIASEDSSVWVSKINRVIETHTK